LNQRAQRPAGRRIDQSRPVILYESVEDPTSPDVIHQRIVCAEDYISSNSEAGFNEQQICWSIIVFVFAYWNEEVHPELPRIRGVKANDIMVNEFGDLRILRKSTVRDGGFLIASEHAKRSRPEAQGAQPGRTHRTPAGLGRQPGGCDRQRRPAGR
jgi:hypothetical protein